MACCSLCGAVEGAVFEFRRVWELRELVGGVAGSAFALCAIGEFTRSDVCPAPPKLGAFGAVFEEDEVVPALFTPAPTVFACVAFSGLESRKESEKPSYSLEFMSRAYLPRANIR